MSNRNLDATWTYHNGTKHSYQSVRAGARGLDWENQPLPFKIYSTLEPIPLPHDFSHPSMPALDAIAASGVEPADAHAPDLHALAGILYLSAGITKRLKRRGGVMDFRAAACTGALYHIELYLVCGDQPALAAGVYHFGVHDFALRRLRAGDYRDIVVRATGVEPSVASAPAIIICTTTPWRNAWKYRTRAYRHAFWDCGTILANLLTTSTGYHVPARVVCGFVDAEVNRLLDLDTECEVAVAVIALGREDISPATATAAGIRGPGPHAAIEPLRLPTVPLSKSEVDYPGIRAMHAASSLLTEEVVRAWRTGAPEAKQRLPGTAAAPSGRLIPLQPFADSALPRDSTSRVIRRRGSSRRFARESISFAQLSTMLDRAVRGVSADFLQPEGGAAPAAAALNTPYLIVHAVEGLASGAYVFHRDRRALELLKEGDFRSEGGYLGLEQELPADASVNVYFLADLPPILERFGNRGYRAAQFDAAIMGGKLYLAAYALGLGATGLTFFDDAVTEFFSPHADGKSVMFLVALGRPARRRAG